MPDFRLLSVVFIFIIHKRPRHCNGSGKKVKKMKQSAQIYGEEKPEHINRVAAALAE